MVLYINKYAAINLSRETTNNSVNNCTTNLKSLSFSILIT